jgi:hypothetical protein
LPDGTEWDSPYPIASGLLGGFGGFVARTFRDHDFQLGRRNCQRFLQTTFLLPQTNRIIRDGYQDVADQTPFIAADRPGRPVIPLLGSARGQVMPPDWPQITGRDLDTLLGRLSTRLTAVAKALLMRQSISMVFNFGVPLVYLFRGRAKRAIERIILADLVKRDQITGWSIPAAWGPSDAAGTLEYPVAVRAVIATLIVPGLKLRSEADIVAACQLKPEMVRDILARCIAARGQPYAVCEWADRNGARRVCLRTYQPGWLTRHLGWDHGHAKFFPK